MARKHYAKTFAWVLAFAILFQTPLSAEVPADGFAKLDNAVSALQTLILQRRSAGDIPRLSDADDAKVLAKIWDADAILGHAPYTAKDGPQLIEMTPRLNSILRDYIYFSQGGRSPPRPQQNEIEFQDEVVRLIDFMLKVTAATMVSTNDFWINLPPEQKTGKRRQGFIQIRSGFRDILTGSLQILTNRNIRPANRLLVADALARDAMTISVVFTPTQRETVITAFRAALPALDPSLRKPLETIAGALSQQECRDLCAVE